MTRTAAASRATPVLLAGVACALVAMLGFAAREEHYVSAEFGTGYALGILGLALMTLLLSYPARKHLRFMSGWGSLRRWFHFHMVLGLLGPTAILLHCNFDLGSTNSSVALACTLFVAGSGVVGRVVYTRIHEALTGRRRTVQELQADVERARTALAERGIAADLARRLGELERFAGKDPAGLLASLWQFAAVGSRVRSAARACRRARRTGALRGDAPALIDAYLVAVRSRARFTVYERIFSLWHALHLPLCFLLFASAGIHVYAVHSY